jgi:hypothetical protein
MRTDARRRFTFGITIENTKTRAWFCCRQVVLVSEQFNFLEVRGSFLDFASSHTLRGRILSNG